jgi:single-stranded-DNA-specific exonuclease
VALAPAGDGLARGSGRSIPGLHLRDVLDLVSKREPRLLISFGGHAAAAGLTLRASDVDRFAAAFDAVVRELVDPATLARTLETDGSLEPEYATLPLAQVLQAEVWGQGFPPPLFADEFAVESQRLVGEKHLRLRLAREGRRFEAIAFRRDAPLPDRVRVAYALGIDEWNGAQGVELRVEHVEER